MTKQWIEWEGNGIRGVNELDGFFWHDGELVIVECKLTWSLLGVAQLEWYREILHHYYDQIPRLLMVCQNLAPGAVEGVVIGDIADWRELEPGKPGSLLFRV